MAKISKILNVSQPGILSSKLMMLLLIFLAVCVFGRPAIAETSIYIFDPSQSDVVKAGGFVGLHETYSVAGHFQLIVDLDAAVASFEMVDANLTDETGSEYGRSLDEIFNMTALSGTVVDDMTIEFEGKTADGTESDVNLKLSFKDDSAHITGKTTPPPNSADMFFYDIDAVAIKKYASGTGESNDPYQIATSEDLMLLGETPEDYDKHFILTTDIDLDPNLPGRKVFDRAVIAPDVNAVEFDFQGTPFTGVFDGNGHAVSHLTITGAGYLGLFGQVALECAEVRNLGVTDVSITGTGSFVGGLAGDDHDSGTVIACYSTGTVSGESDVGGLVGHSFRGVIDASWSSATVMGQSGVGGLVGSSNEGYITASFSAGGVHGGLIVGGLVGSNNSWNNRASVIDCYSTSWVTGDDDVGGLVGYDDIGGIITSSFWDIQTSDQFISAGGIGKFTAEMQTAATFLEAGWDFVDETENGTQDVWSICEGTNYPRFVWQIAAGDFVCPEGITIDDFVFFMEHWLEDNCDSSNGYCQGTDLDQSGTVDVNDLEIFFENWSAEQ